MSDRYDAGVRVAAAPAAGAVYLELRNTGARRVRLEEFGVFVGAATATGVGLVRATSQGTGGTGVVGQSDDPNAPGAAASLVPAAFTVAPAIGATPAYKRRLILPASIGGGVIWTWPASDPLIVPPSGSLVVTNIAAAAGSAIIDAYAVWRE